MAAPLASPDDPKSKMPPCFWKESELGEGTGKCLCWTTRRAFWVEGVQKGELTYESTHERSYESSTRVTREFTRDWGKKIAVHLGKRAFAGDC